MKYGKERILIVDDDQRVRRLLERYMTRNGFLVECASNGHMMVEFLKSNEVSLILLDVMMPGEDGISLARKVRQVSDVPIIMLTGRSDTIDKVAGLEVGADDYVTKPFDERELLARARSVMRRHAALKEGEDEPQGQDSVHFNDWRLDKKAHELIDSDGKVTYLTRHEFILLEAFLQRPRHILTRNEILDLLSGREWQSSDRSIDVLVGKLRKKLECDPKKPRYIMTVRGVGYKFCIN